MSAKPWITVDSSFSDQVKELMSVAAPVAAEVLERRLGHVFRRAQLQWPVRKEGSLDSRGKVALTYSIRGGKFVATLKNDATYAYYIHNGKTAQDLILKPGMEAALAAAKEIPAEIARRSGGT